VRDRRFDWLYDRQRQPVKQVILARFADEVARELGEWPPPVVEWVSDDLRARYAAGLAERPGDAVLRLALELARLDLAREFEAVDRRVREEGAGCLRRPADAAACHLLVCFLTEKALALKEWAEGARLTRADLVGLVGLVEERLFRVIG
jgi:hypothetical protein